MKASRVHGECNYCALAFVREATVRRAVSILRAIDALRRCRISPLLVKEGKSLKRDTMTVEDAPQSPHSRDRTSTRIVDDVPVWGRFNRRWSLDKSTKKSQRDFAPKPRVARNELPWVNGSRTPQPQRGCDLTSKETCPPIAVVHLYSPRLLHQREYIARQGKHHRKMTFQEEW